MHLNNETLKSITNVCGMLAHCWESKEVVVLAYQKLVVILLHPFHGHARYQQQTYARF